MKPVFQIERFSLKWLYLNSVTKKYCNLLILYFEITGKAEVKQNKTKRNWQKHEQIKYSLNKVKIIRNRKVCREKIYLLQHEYFYSLKCDLQLESDESE